MKIHSLRLGVSLGIIWGFTMIVLAFLANKHYGLPLFQSISKIYIGCNQNNFFSKILCGLIGFIDAFVLGFLIGFIYNRIPI